MRVERFDPAADPGAVRACHEIHLAGAGADDPDSPPMSLRVFAGWLAEGWTEDPSQTWLAFDDAGAPAAWLAMFLPEREDRRLARVHPLVRPARRRAGVGAWLVRHAAAQARSLDRRTLAGETREGSPGAGFARGLGARPGISESRRVLAVDQIPPGRLAGLRSLAERAARGYTLLSWTGATPQSELAAVAAVMAGENDAPRDEGHEAAVWDEQRVRQMDTRKAVQGFRFYTVAARKEPAGELAALTAMAVDPADPGWGFQELTVVAPPHRGRRLGLLVKLAMLELLADREPQVRRVITGNADANQHMIAINDQLGFQWQSRWRSWELPVAAALMLPQAPPRTTPPTGQS